MLLKKSCLIILVFLSNLSYCQFKGIVIDSTTMMPIENVNIWLENGIIVTTTNKEGSFELKKNDNIKWLKFSSIGYEDKKIMIDSLKNVITLKQKIYILDEILIESKKVLKIGSLKKSKIRDYFTSATGNLKIGRYFPFLEKYKNNKYINKIRIVTKSEIDNVTFKVSLYESDTTGKPNKLIHNENIFGVAKKGKSYSEIDLSYLNIQIPKNGIFISLEWVYNDGNIYEIKMNGVNYSVSLLEPKFGIMYGSSKSNSWIYSKGDWEKVREITRSKNKKILKYVPMEIILTE